MSCHFVLELCNVLLRKVLQVCRLQKEGLICAGTFLSGLAVVYLAARGNVWPPLYKAAGRLLFLLPVFEFGQLYCRKLEYYYVPGGIEPVKLVYLAAGVLFPLGAARAFQWLRERLAEKKRAGIVVYQEKEIGVSPGAEGFG